MHLIDAFIQPILTEISPVFILIKELISKFSGLPLFGFMRVIHCKVFLVA